MNTLSFTTPDGEVYTATFNADNKGWYIDKNGADHAFVPYSRIFKIDTVEYMATTKEEALRLGRMIIRINEEAFTQFEKNHPELNP